MARSIDEIVYEAGWSAQQTNELLLRFVQSKGLNRKLRDWLIERALDEARAEAKKASR